MNRPVSTLWLVLCLLATAIANTAADPSVPMPALSGGESMPVDRLEVKTADGRTVPFAELIGPDGRAVCFAFLHPACPMAQDYAPVLVELAARFAGDGISIVGVVCEADDPAEVEAYRTEFGVTFPIFFDTEFTLAEALDATITPEAVLVDRDRRINYTGRIDDRYKIRGVMTPGDAEPELANAIRDLLAGGEVREPRTEAAGCPLDRPERPAASAVVAPAAPTFCKDILPFIHAQCQKCHSPGQAGPFSLLSYDDAVEWVDIGLEEIQARRMPPASRREIPPTRHRSRRCRTTRHFRRVSAPPTSCSSSLSRRISAPTATTSTATSCFR